MRTTVYYKPQKPTPAAKRLSYLEVARATGAAGWGKQSAEKHAEAVATWRAESAFDPFGALCYLLISGSPGRTERWEADAKRFSLSGRELPMPNYLLKGGEWTQPDEPSYFWRKAYWRNVEFVRYIPVDGAAAPGYPDLQKALDERWLANGKLPHQRIVFEQTDLKQDRIDFGLVMLNSQHHRITWGLYVDHLRTAYTMFKKRGFQPWVAHSNGNYKAFMGAARTAVKKVRS